MAGAALINKTKAYQSKRFHNSSRSLKSVIPAERPLTHKELILGAAHKESKGRSPNPPYCAQHFRFLASKEWQARGAC